jgi:hypothetical protein
MSIPNQPGNPAIFSGEYLVDMIVDLEQARIDARLAHGVANGWSEGEKASLDRTFAITDEDYETILHGLSDETLRRIAQKRAGLYIAQQKDVDAQNKLNGLTDLLIESISSNYLHRPATVRNLDLDEAPISQYHHRFFHNGSLRRGEVPQATGKIWLCAGGILKLYTGKTPNSRGKIFEARVSSDKAVPLVEVEMLD